VRYWSRIGWLLTLGAMAVPALAAQDLAEICGAATRVHVGEWASFAVTGGRDQGARLRLAIVGSERRGDTTLYWLEISHTAAGDQARAGIWQLLVSGFGTQAAAVHGVVMKTGGGPAIRLPERFVGTMSERLGRNNPAFQMAQSCAGAVPIGWEQVATADGPVRALHVKGAEGGEAWLAPDIPFQLVKLRSPDGGELVVSGHGTDAKSSITETPLDVPEPEPAPAR
jgi:hypothetical protein